MTRRFRFAVVGVVGLILAGCASEAQSLNSMQPMAVQTAEARGRFELNCPNAEATVLSREVVQPVLQGRSLAAAFSAPSTPLASLAAARGRLSSSSVLTVETAASRQGPDASSGSRQMTATRLRCALALALATLLAGQPIITAALSGTKRH